jgi:uncharacterized protein (DUF697 family)
MNEVVEKNPLSRSEQASKIIRNYSLGSMVPSLIPVPLLDLAAVTGIQLKMLHSLSQVYGVEFKEELSRAAISSLIGGTVALSAIPGIGSLVGAATMPVISGGTTYALGQVFTQHFESGGTFLSFDAAKVRAYFEQQLAEGKALVAAAKSSGDPAKPK